MNERIRTFSGTHDWDPSVLIETDADEQGSADDIIWNIEHGRCPRCEGPLPTGRELPAGSRVTACRSIPICGPCGNDESHEQLDYLEGIGWDLSPASYWPIPIKKIEERRTRIMSQMKPAILDVASGTVISEDGVGQVSNPRNTGGWAQYGSVEERGQSGDD